MGYSVSLTYALKVLEEEKENMVRKNCKQLNIKSKNQ